LDQSVFPSIKQVKWIDCFALPALVSRNIRLNEATLK
jgi:hypothetical protein